MKFVVNMLWPDGTESALEEEFDTYEEAEEAGLNNCSCFAAGVDILEMAGQGHMVGDADFEVIEVED